MSAAVLVLNTCKSYSYSLLCLLWISFKIVAWKSDLLIIYGRQLQPHKHTLSHLLKQTYFPGISEKPSLEISDCCARYCFLRNMFCRSVNLPNFCTTFLRALIEHIGNKNQSVKILLHWKPYYGYCLINREWTKHLRVFNEFYYLFPKTMAN